MELAKRNLGLGALLLIAGCTGGGASEPVAVESDERVLYACRPEAGAPHSRIDVLEITMTPEELASARDDLRDAEDEPPTDPDTTTLETNVRFAVYDGEDGAEGHCFRRNDGGKYSCQSFDGSLKLDFDDAVDGKAPTGAAPVQVREKWLFGTKRYKATCSRKD